MYKNFFMLQSSLLDGMDTSGKSEEPEQQSEPEASDEMLELPEFLKGVDPDLAKEPMLKNYKDINSMVKSLVHAQKAIGKDKVVLPGKNSSKEEWDKLFTALGKPESVEKYGIDVKSSKLGEEFTSALLQQAFDSGMLPSQIKGISKFLEANIEGEQAKVRQAFEERLNKEMEDLRKDWSDSFDSNMGYAKNALREFADESFMQYLKDSGMDRDTNLIRLLSKVGKAMGDDVFHGKGSESVGLTQDEVRERIKTLRSDLDGPLYNRAHADHKKTLEEMERLYKKLN